MDFRLDLILIYNLKKNRNVSTKITLSYLHTESLSQYFLSVFFLEFKIWSKYQLTRTT